ncbi:hypothetical protein XENOCAPTIV_006143 [Xenoophorus captivus]|uniref:SAP domain-containing protein n=1 Tax=Xenoophorus captivus TaxID=1517983 RepID=A0ABV0QRG3_9TELE
MHILEETQVEPSLQATQIRLKRARLANDLNEKIAQRPGPMELVEKKILPVDSGVEELRNSRHTTQVPDVYSFDEDSSDALSPRQPNSQPSPPQTLPSPENSRETEASYASSDFSPPPQVRKYQTLVKLSTDKSRSKKIKEPKSRVKKLKYHQYIPPDQKQELSGVPMDSSYARLLEQQQQFLQLQILSLQQQKYNCQAVVPVTLKYAANQQFIVCKVTYHVAELKVELKLRSLPVSGTKTDLIERLKLFHESAKSQRVAAMESRVTAANSRSENINVTPPVSLIASKVSKLGIEDSNMKDIHTKSDSETLSNAALCTSPSKGTPHQECPTDAKVNEKDSEKDKRLHEKERQIEELMRKLEQEQKLVEKLKMLLEVEKRSQQSDSPPHLSSLVPFQIKEENRSLPNCTLSCSSPGLHVQIKQEDPSDHTHITCSNQFINDQGTNTTAENLQSVQALLPTSLPGSAVAVEIPAKGIKLHTTVNSIASGHIQASGHEPEKSAAQQQQSSTQTQHLTKVHTLCCVHSTLFYHLGLISLSRHTLLHGEWILRGKVHSMHSWCLDVIVLPLTKHPRKHLEGRQDPPSLEKPLPVTASVTTLPINTVLTRSPPLVQLAQLPEATLSSPGSNLETFLDDTEAQRLKLMEELNSPLVNMEMNFSENIPPSGVNLQNTTVDSMDWLDLTLSVPAEGINPLDMSVPGAVFSSDFLDSHELHLNWD